MWLHAVLALLLFEKPDPQADGIKALEQQRYESAVASFQKAVAADPKDYGAQFHLALAYSLAGNDAEAAPAYRRVLELKPGLYEAELNLAIVLVRQGKHSDAVALAESASRRKPKEFRPAFYYAEALLGAGSAGPAEAQYQVARDLDPKSAPVELGLARAIAKQNRLADAAPHFERAAALDATFGDVLLELAALYEKANMPKEAAAVYQKFPENAVARERLGELLLEAGDAANAIPELEAAVKSSPTPANRYALATAYVAAKQIDRAIPVLEDAIKAEPANADLRAMYGRALREQRKYPQAAEQFMQVVNARQGSAEAWGDLAGMLVLMDRHAEALVALDKVRALNGEKPGHHFLRAIILDKNKIYEAALASYETFLQLSGNKFPDEEFKSRQRVRIIRKRIGEEITLLRTLFQFVFAVAAAAAVETSLEEIQKNPNLEKRSELALGFADQSINAARKAYHDEDDKLFGAILEKIEEGVELSYKSLQDTGKAARRSPKYFKRAELKLRGLMKRLDALEREISIDHREPVAAVKTRVSEVHEQLLLDIMTKK